MKTLHILNLGAGVQSTTLYLMSHRQDEPEHVPRFDYAIFADTGDEPYAVYAHLQWLKSLGGPEILVRSYGHLSSDLIRGHKGKGRKFSSIPAFVDKPGEPRGMVRRQCTSVYKVEVIEQTIKREILGVPFRGRIPSDVRIIQYFGLSFEETARIIPTRNRVLHKGWEPRFPLFDLQMKRRDCETYNLEHIPHPVPRSACIMCPFRSNAEWRRLRDESPVEFAMACHIDEQMRNPESKCTQGMEGTLYLHSSLQPLIRAPIDTPESRGEQYTFGFASECEGMCGL